MPPFCHRDWLNRLVCRLKNEVSSGVENNWVVYMNGIFNR